MNISFTTSFTDIIDMSQLINETESCALTAIQRKLITTLYHLQAYNFSRLPPSDSVIAALIFFMCLIMAVGLVANVLVIWWIKAGKKKKTSVDAYIVSLSVADLLTLSSRIPHHIDLLIKNYNYFDYPEAARNVLCKGGAFLQSAVVFVSHLTLIFVAIDRYIAICHPLFHYKTSTTRKNMVVVVITIVIWVIGFSVAVADLVLTRVSYTLHDSAEYYKYGYETEAAFLGNELVYVLDTNYYATNNELIPAAHPEICQEVYFHGNCGYNHGPDDLKFMYFAILYVLPFGVMSFCYISIVFKLWVRKPVGDVLISSRQHAHIKASTKQNITSMIVLVAVFGLLWMPYWVWRLGFSAGGGPNQTPNEPIKLDVTAISFQIVSYLSIVSSPIIYMFMDRGFREVIRKKFIICKTTLSYC